MPPYVFYERCALRYSNKDFLRHLWLQRHAVGRKEDRSQQNASVPAAVFAAAVQCPPQGHGRLRGNQVTQEVWYRGAA